MLFFRNSCFSFQILFWIDFSMISVACGNIPAPGLGVGGCIRRRCSCVRFSCISPRRLPLFSVSRWASWVLGSVLVQFWFRFGYWVAKREPKGGLREPKRRHGVAKGRRRKPKGDQERPLSGQRGPKERQREAGLSGRCWGLGPFRAPFLVHFWMYFRVYFFNLFACFLLRFVGQI